MHCSYNYSALLEFDFDPLKAGAKRWAGTVRCTLRFISQRHTDTLSSHQSDSPAPEALCQDDIWRGNHYDTATLTPFFNK